MAEPRALAARPSWSSAGWVVAVVAVSLLVAVPLWRLFAAALDDGAVTALRTLTDGRTTRAVVNTLWTSLAVTVLSVSVGAAAAYVTERGRAPGRTLLRGSMVAALLAAPLVSALGWARAYGPGGLTDRLFGWSWPGLFGPAGIVAVLAAGAVPIAYLVVAAGLATRAEPDVERAARVSGASGIRAVLSVTLPLSLPAIGAAAALVFVGAVNAFEVPAVLGIPAGFPTMTTRLYESLALSADPRAFTTAVAIACALVLLAFAVVGPTDALTRGGALRTAGATGSAAAGRRSWSATVAVLTWLGVTVVVPLVALCLVALTRAVGLAPTPANWTLRNFAVAAAGRTGAALGHSLVLAVGAASAIVVLGGITAALGRAGLGRAFGSVVTLSFAVAGSALAVAVLLAYGRFLRDTLALILVAYVAKFWALGHRPLAGTAERLPADVVRAGRVSGGNAWTTLLTVVAPLLRPALVGAWLLAFLFAVHELTMSSLLYGPGNETLAVLILNQQQIGNVSVTSALSVLLTALIAVAALLLLLVQRVGAAAGRRG